VKALLLMVDTYCRVKAEREAKEHTRKRREKKSWDDMFAVEAETANADGCLREKTQQETRKRKDHQHVNTEVDGDEKATSDTDSDIYGDDGGWKGYSTWMFYIELLQELVR
jgi:hypothetical protein